MLIVFTKDYSIYCEESVRCVASDVFLAMSIVGMWLRNTKEIWSTTDGVIYKVPLGHRDVTIKSVTLNTPDVGELLKLDPLPLVFQDEG